MATIEERLAQMAKREERLAQMANIEERLTQRVKGASKGVNPPSTPKIQRVPGFLRQNKDFVKYCIPKVISFGPIHYLDENLDQGQRYKAQWTSMYIKDYIEKINGSIEAAGKLLLRTTQNQIWELKKLFSEDVVEGYKDEELAWMLFEDGCSLLYYMRHIDSENPGKLGLKLDQLMYIWRDIILLENQIPMKVLELLNGNKGVELMALVYNFQTLGIEKQEGLYQLALPDNTIHILDFCRTAYVVMKDDTVKIEDAPEEDNDKKASQTYKNIRIRDLEAAGIHVKASKTDNWSLSAVNFTSGWFHGELELPECRCNDFMPYLFSNLIAYEMCPDFANNLAFCSFFTFMDSLIDDVEDVKVLRLAGVFPNSLNNNEELTQFFNQIGRELPANLLFNNPQFDNEAYHKQYKHLTLQIQNHYTNTWKTWFAELLTTYFDAPSSTTTFMSALAALTLTAIQTWYAIHAKS